MNEQTNSGDERLAIGIDPSSTVIGLAVLRDRELIDLQRFRAPVRWSPMGRIVYLVWHLVSYLAEIPGISAEAMIVETSSGKVARRHRGQGAGLAVYGAAVGAVVAMILERFGGLYIVDELTWTAGRPKQKRCEGLSLQFWRYRELLRAGGDPGGDLGDALGLACYLENNYRSRNATGSSPPVGPPSEEVYATGLMALRYPENGGAPGRVYAAPGRSSEVRRVGKST